MTDDAAVRFAHRIQALFAQRTDSAVDVALLSTLRTGVLAEIRQAMAEGVIFMDEEMKPMRDFNEVDVLVEFDAITGNGHVHIIRSRPDDLERFRKDNPTIFN